MTWDPAVLRKYSTTSHFRLLNQVRGELKTSPLSRHQNGELNLAMGRKGPSPRVPVQLRSGLIPPPLAPEAASSGPLPSPDNSTGDAPSFRDRLRAIEMR